MIVYVNVGEEGAKLNWGEDVLNTMDIDCCCWNTLFVVQIVTNRWKDMCVEFVVLLGVQIVDHV